MVVIDVQSCCLCCAEPISPSLSSRGSESAAARKYFAGASFNDGQGGFTQGVSPTYTRATSSGLASHPGSSPLAGGTAGATSQSSRTLPEEDSYLQSTRASQGSLDTNRDFALRSLGSLGNQSGLTNEHSGISHTRDPSVGSAAELVHSSSITPGVTAGSSAISSLPPSASWGSAPIQALTPPTPIPAYTPPATSPSLASDSGVRPGEPHSSSEATYSTQNAFPTPVQDDTFEQALAETDSNHIPAGGASAQHGFTSDKLEPSFSDAAAQGGFASQGYLNTSAQHAQHESEYPAQEAGQISLDHDKGDLAHGRFEPPAQHTQREHVSEPAYQAQGAGLDQPAQDDFTDQAFFQPAQREQHLEPEYQAQNAGLDQSAQDNFGDQAFSQPAQHEQHQESAYQAQGAGLRQPAQEDFADQAFSQPAQHEQHPESGYQAQVAGLGQPAQHDFADQALTQSALSKQHSEPAHQAGLAQTAQDGFADQSFAQPELQQEARPASNAQSQSSDASAKLRPTGIPAEQPVKHNQATTEQAHTARGVPVSPTYSNQDTVVSPVGQVTQASPTYSTRDTVSSPAAQGSQAGPLDDAFAQFSPFAKKGSQQANPFASSAVATLAAQEPQLHNALPVETAAKVG